MNPIYEKLMHCYKQVREKTDFVPKVALVLGSGLGDYADHIRIEAVVDYHDIDIRDGLSLAMSGRSLW